MVVAGAAGASPPSASMLTKNLNAPVCCTPSRNCRLMLPPAASGVTNVIVPANIVLCRPPPNAWAGGVSTVVPSTVIVQGVVATPFEARQVAESAIPLTVTAAELRALRSATAPGGKKALISIIRNRKRVTGAPVLFTNRCLIVSVPFAALGCTAA